MINFPTIDLTNLLPIIGLAIIAAIAIAALLLHSVLHSRIALLIAVVAGVVIAGPTLAGALVQIVGALVPLLIVLAAAAFGALYLLHRNSDLMQLLRDLIPQRTAAAPLAPPSNSQTALTVIDQPSAQPQRASRIQIVDSDRWGF